MTADGGRRTAEVGLVTSTRVSEPSSVDMDDDADPWVGPRVATHPGMHKVR